MLAEPGVGTPHSLGHADDLTSGLGGLLAELTSVDGLIMTAAHLAASVDLGLWLATGERLLWFGLCRIAYAARRGLVAMGEALVWVRSQLPTPSRRPVVWLNVVSDRGLVDWLVATHAGSAAGRLTKRRIPSPIPRHTAGWHPNLPGETRMTTTVGASARPKTDLPTPAPRRRFAAFWRWHFFASFLVIPVLAVLAVTGLIYLFRFQLEPALHPDVMRIPAPAAGQSMASCDAQLEIVQDALTADKRDGAAVVMMTEALTPITPTRFTVTERRAPT